MTGAVRAAEDDILDAVTSGTADDPFAILGPHAATHNGRPVIVIRTMQPSSTSVDLLVGDRALPMDKRRPDGLFELSIDADGRSPADLFYRLRAHDDGASSEFIDPYRFGQVLGDLDLHLFSEGTHYRAWEKLGSRRLSVDGVTG